MRRWLVVTIAVAGLALLVAAVTLLVGVPRRRTAAPLRTPSTSATPQTGTLVASVPVYYVGGGRLFREYHDLKVSPDTVPGRVAAAVTEMLRAGSPADPDYTTLWPAGIAVRGVHIDGGIATVDLAGVVPSPGRLAVQQLVWTVAAAVADTPVGHVDGVALRVDGTSLGVLRAEPAADVLAPVWLVEPHEGATVGKTFTVRIAGTVLDATPHLRVRAAGAVVKEDVVTLERGEATLQLTLAPGRYTVEAFTVKDGSVEALDDHTVTVK